MPHAEYMFQISKTTSSKMPTSGKIKTFKCFGLYRPRLEGVFSRKVTRRVRFVIKGLLNGFILEFTDRAINYLLGDKRICAQGKKRLFFAFQALTKKSAKSDRSYVKRPTVSPKVTFMMK